MSKLSPKKADPLLERFGRGVELVQNGVLTVKELVNEIMVSLAGSEKFDLVKDTTDLLPGTILNELRTTIRKIIQGDPSYRPFTIGRPTPERWQKVLVGLRPLADRFQLLLEMDLKKRSETSLAWDLEISQLFSRKPV